MSKGPYISRHIAMSLDDRNSLQKFCDILYSNYVMKQNRTIECGCMERERISKFFYFFRDSKITATPHTNTARTPCVKIIIEKHDMHQAVVVAWSFFKLGCEEHWKFVQCGGDWTCTSWQLSIRTKHQGRQIKRGNTRYPVTWMAQCTHVGHAPLKHSGVSRCGYLL